MVDLSDMNKVAPIEFRCSKFHYNFIPGSESSVSFHQALQDTVANNVFEAEVIQKILEYKWGIVKYYAYA